MSKNVVRHVTALQRLSYPELQARWRELHGTEPPSYNRSVLVRRLAYRVQELAHGGLSDATRAELRARLPEGDVDPQKVGSARRAQRRRKNGALVVGTQLVREWGGERHTVTVVEGGFEYRGRRFRSLSAVAREVTQTRWNGPRFFGLRSPEAKEE